jgi:MFS family permease
MSSDHSMHSKTSLDEKPRDERDIEKPIDEHDVEKGIANNDISPPAPQQAPETKPAGPSPPPNGGIQAWTQVAGGFMLFFNTWGLLNTFGVYQTYYESGQLFHATSSDISWIGAVQSFMLLLTGLLSGPIFDRGYLRYLLVFGSFLVVFGHMMLSLCTELWQAMLAQGFAIGIGSGCLFVPAVAILPTYFSTKIGMAIGLAASGSSMGGIIYPIVFYRLLPQIGFGWSVRVLGFMTLATLLIPIFVMRMRVQPPKARALIDTSAFKDAPFMIFVFGGMIGFIGLYVGLFYISFFGEATGITDEALSFYLVPILNAGSVLGRTLPNILADKIGPFNVLVPGATIVSVILFSLIAVNAAGGLIAATVFFGIFSGVFIALPPVCFVALTEDKTKIGTRIGMGMAIFALGTLVGGPGGGAILQMHPEHLNWTGMWAFGASCVMCSVLIYSVVRVLKGGIKLVKV